jgi:hypothetical protein
MKNDRCCDPYFHMFPNVNVKGEQKLIGPVACSQMQSKESLFYGDKVWADMFILQSGKSVTPMLSRVMTVALTFMGCIFLSPCR